MASATALRGPSSPADPSTRAGAPARTRAPGRAGRDVSAAVRLVAFAVLALYGALHWVGQLSPAPSAVAWAAAGLAVLLAVVLPRIGSRVLRVAVVALAVLAALPIAGVPLALLDPRAWGELVSGIGEGVRALPNTLVPYRGVDPWIRVVMEAGGVLLAIAAGALAGWRPRKARQGGRPGLDVAAAVALSLLWAVPVVGRNPDQPWLDGAVFALALATFLWAGRLRRAHAAAGVGLLVVAVLAALVVAPRVEPDDPWVDYQELASNLAPKKPSTFDWSHSYEPLAWPRDGRVLLRAQAPAETYFKAQVLETFDGVRWLHDDARASLGSEGVVDRRPEWRQKIRMRITNLRSRQLVTAGTAIRLEDWTRPVAPAGGGTFEAVGRPLRPGDAYTVDAYTPRPTAAELQGTAGETYPAEVEPSLVVSMPSSVREVQPVPGRPSQVRTSYRVRFPDFRTGGSELLVADPNGAVYRVGDTVLQTTPYAQTYALAQRLRAQSSGPYDFVRRVQERVQDGARYTEQPEPGGLLPLQGFLFDTREGYCQQFSGAMALLLRMGGIPARVVSGFTPGVYDATRKEWKVRDLDAHSWVEAYFPTIGWVTFDPTPASAPPAGQAALDEGADERRADEGGSPLTAGDRGSDPTAGGPADPEAAGAEEGGGDATPAVLLGLALLAGLVAGAAWWSRRAARADRRPGESAELAELRRALRRTGRPAAARTTLAELERGLRGSPEAAAYLAALRAERFARPGVAPAPSPEARRALRAELVDGLGWRGWLRGWWALPPRPRPRARGRRAPQPI